MAYPALWSRCFANTGRTGDQHDVFSIRGLAFARRPGRQPRAVLNSDLTPTERTQAGLGLDIGRSRLHPCGQGARRGSARLGFCRGAILSLWKIVAQ